MNRDPIHTSMLEDFIKEVPGAEGIILIAIRKEGGDRSVEASSACHLHDIYRSCAALLDAIITGGEQGSPITDPQERAMVTVLYEALLDLSGDDSSSAHGNVEAFKIGKA